MKVGISLDNTIPERWNKEIAIIKKTIEEAGGELILKTAFGLEDSQDNDIRDLINVDQVDVVIIVPIEVDRSVKIANYANTKGVGVISYSRPIPSHGIDFHVGFNVFEIGVNQAEYLVKKQPSGKYLIVHGSKGDSNTDVLLKGQMDVLSKYPDIQVLDTIFLDGWTRLKATQAIKKFLTASTDEVTAVLAANDMIAEAAYNCLTEMGKTGVLIAGVDAEIKACQRILKDKQAMTILLPPNDIAKCVSNIALYLASKNADYISGYDIVNQTTEDGFTSKSINIQSIVLDKSNVKEMIASHNVFPGWWLR